MKPRELCEASSNRAASYYAPLPGGLEYRNVEIDNLTLCFPNSHWGLLPPDEARPVGPEAARLAAVCPLRYLAARCHRPSSCHFLECPIALHPLNHAGSQPQAVQQYIPSL